MSKDKKQEKRPEALAESAGSHDALPRWAVVAGLLMIAGGAALYFAREPMRRSAAVEAFNKASVQVKDIDDGLSGRFALVSIASNRREFLDVLGASATDPELARHVFGTVMKQGTSEGRILCCQLAFYLARDGKQDAAALKEVLAAVAEQLAADRKPELRAAAQWALGHLLAVKDPSKAGQFEKLPGQPKEVKGAWQAKAEEDTFGDGANAVQTATLRWSTPDACLAWWQTHGNRAGSWDDKLKRFTLE